MDNVLENLRRYFENTPKEELDRYSMENAYLNEIGPDVIEHVECVKIYFELGTPYAISNPLNGFHEFETENIEILDDSKYYLAA